MKQSAGAANGFVVAGMLFLVAAILPAVRGGDLEPKYIPLAIFFLVLGVARRRKGRAPEAAPVSTIGGKER